MAEFFLSKVVGRHSDVDMHHLASLDPVMYRNLLYLKNYDGDVTDLGLDFTVVHDELGETKVSIGFISGFQVNCQTTTASQWRCTLYIQGV